MNSKSVLWLVSILLAGPALAAEYGTADEAKAMLEKVVAAIRKDKAAALAMFTKGEGGFKDRDLYPFCTSLYDGITTAHPTLVGTDVTKLRDKTGKAFGQEMLKVAEEGKFKEVSYMWPKPGSTDPAQKVSFVTKVGDQICGVGYYK